MVPRNSIPTILGGEERRHSETVLAETCYLYRRTASTFERNIQTEDSDRRCGHNIQTEDADGAIPTKRSD